MIKVLKAKKIYKITFPLFLKCFFLKFRFEFKITETQLWPLKQFKSLSYQAFTIHHKNLYIKSTLDIANFYRKLLY